MATSVNGDGSRNESRVLIVDDNEATARALAKVLTLERYEPVVTYRASEALAKVDQTAFSAAIVDIHLPDMSGLVVAQKLRERWGDKTPIIILSGDTSISTLNSLPHVGATYFFSKPLNTSQFITRLREWVAPSSQSAASAT